MKSKEALKILSECANGEKKLLFSHCLELENIIKKNLDRLEKLEKAIDIIKNKNVNLSELYHLFKWNETTPTEYNEGLGKDYKLTQEEYELLKGVLYNDK